MSLFPLGLISQGGGAAGVVGFELISTQVLVSGTSTVTFSSIPSTYKHLQIRFAWLGPSYSSIRLRFNSDSAANYNSTWVNGEGANVFTSFEGATSLNLNGNQAGGDTSYPLVGICNILDAFNTNKWKTSQTLAGIVRATPKEIAQLSGRWNSTAAVSSISLINDSGNFSANSRFSLYGSNG